MWKNSILDAQECYDLDWFAMKIADTGIPILPFITLVPTASFLLFMLVKLPSICGQLGRSESLIIPTYYYFNWCVMLVATVRAVVSVTPWGSHEYWRYVLVYVMPFLYFFFKFAVIVFMNHRADIVSGLESIKISLLISFVISSAITLIEVFMDILFKIPIWYSVHPYEQIVSGFWFSIHTTIVIMSFTFIFLNYTKFRSIISKAKSFFRFMVFLLITHLLYSIGQMFLILDLKIGYCFNSAGVIMEWGFMSPILYISFLHSYFKAINLPKPLLEMRHRGYLNTDT